MTTIAQQLKVSEFDFEIKDKNDNLIYYEDVTNFWAKREFDKNNNLIYYQDSYGFWAKREFDKNNNLIYYETSDDIICDNRPKQIQEYTMEELTKIVGKEFKLVK